MGRYLIVLLCIVSILGLFPAFENWKPDKCVLNPTLPISGIPVSLLLIWSGNYLLWMHTSSAFLNTVSFQSVYCPNGLPHLCWNYICLDFRHVQELQSDGFNPWNLSSSSFVSQDRPVSAMKLNGTPLKWHHLKFNWESSLLSHFGCLVSSPSCWRKKRN